MKVFIRTIAVSCLIVLGACQMSGGRKPMPTGKFKRNYQNHAISFPDAPTKSGDIVFQITAGVMTEVSTVISRESWNANFQIEVTNASMRTIDISSIKVSVVSEPAPCSGGSPSNYTGDWTKSAAGAVELPHGKTGRFDISMTCLSGDLISQPFHMKINSAMIPLGKK